MRKNRLFQGVVMGTAVLLMAGCGQSRIANTVEEEAAKPEIINSYDNTAELAEQFRVVNPTPIESDLEKKIQNRLLTGFANWNKGYDAWEEWGNILYTPDSMYNLNAIRFTLTEYQASQKLGLSASDIQMGDFQNMIICGDWTAIRYDISSTNRKSGETSEGTVMEFVNFKDYGDDLGTRVVEGWAGTRGKNSEFMQKFQTEEEKDWQQSFFDSIVNTELLETENLEEKYPVKNPTPAHSELASEIQTVILEDFENWNQGYEAWAVWADQYYDMDYRYHATGVNADLSEYKTMVRETAENTKITRLYFDNMLISGDWAAIHYRTVREDLNSGSKEADDVMQFLHFAKNGDSVKVLESWTK